MHNITCHSLLLAEHSNSYGMFICGYCFLLAEKGYQNIESFLVGFLLLLIYDSANSPCHAKKWRQLLLRGVLIVQYIYYKCTEFKKYADHSHDQQPYFKKCYIDHYR